MDISEKYLLLLRKSAKEKQKIVEARIEMFVNFKLEGLDPNAKTLKFYPLVKVKRKLMSFTLVP